MKKIYWLGNTKEKVRGFPAQAKQDIGYALDLIQRGSEPPDWKPMTSIGTGVSEIRVHAGNEYRVIYIAKFYDFVYVLNAFVKKDEKTNKQDLVFAKKRFAELKTMRAKT